MVAESPFWAISGRTETVCCCDTVPRVGANRWPCVISVERSTRKNQEETFSLNRLKLSIPELGQDITRLARGYGIHRDPRSRLGPRIAALTGIEDHDPIGVVTGKLLKLFEQAIAALPDEKLMEIATVELNLRNEAVRVVERRVAHQARGGPSPRSSAEKMRLEIVPELVRLILSDPTRLGTA